jgi:trypsin-like peptidase
MALKLFGFAIVLAVIIGAQPGERTVIRFDEPSLMVTRKAEHLENLPLMVSNGCLSTQYTKDADVVYIHLTAMATNKLSWTATLPGASMAGSGRPSAQWSKRLDPRGQVKICSSHPATPPDLVAQISWTSKPPAEPQATTGDGDIEWINIQDSRLAVVRRTTAILWLRLGNDTIRSCTGFLISKKLLLTNYHCVSGDISWDQSSAGFDYTKENGAVTQRGVLDTNYRFPEIDAAIIELDRPIDRCPLKWSATDAWPTESLLIVQHPNGWPQSVATRKCFVPDQLRNQGDPITDFRHLCGTREGSSGSAVLDYVSLKVVGLHHAGYDDQAKVKLNFAVTISKVREALNSKDPHILDLTTEATKCESP